MNTRVFTDTNLFIYAESQDVHKAMRAIEIIEDYPVISRQVISASAPCVALPPASLQSNETVSVLTRKQGFSLAEAHEIGESLLDYLSASGWRVDKNEPIGFVLA